MNQQPDKIILPSNYLLMPASALAELRSQMEARIRQIDEQIKDAVRKNPRMEPDRFGSADWHSRARRAQDYYRRDIARIRDHLNNLAGAQRQELAPKREAKVNTAFRQVARRRLTEVLYEGILKEAKEEVEEAGQ